MRKFPLLTTVVLSSLAQWMFIEIYNIVATGILVGFAGVCFVDWLGVLLTAMLGGLIAHYYYFKDDKRICGLAGIVFYLVYIEMQGLMVNTLEYVCKLAVIFLVGYLSPYIYEKHIKQHTKNNSLTNT